MKKSFKTYLEDTPIIAAVKSDEELAEAIKTDIQVIFILYGDVCTIEEIVGRIKEAGRVAMVHLDLVSGLSPKEATLRFLKEKIGADGIITTKSSLVRYAKELGLYVVVRFFVVDSMALASIEYQCRDNWPDAIEVLPGVMPKIVKKINQMSRVPVISGGLIADKDDVVAALNAGAIAISATSRKVWEM